MSITKSVITGGPCVGKSTALSKVSNGLTTLGYKVLIMSESATEFITNGISHITKNFQKHLLKYQLQKEDLYDRGAMDGKVYTSQEEFNNILKSLNLNELTLRDHYDAVFHLVTAAKSTEDFYTLENNAARWESLEEAIDIDNKLIDAWTGHPHFRIIDNSTDFETKIHRLIKEITLFLGEPEPFEIERKFLIEYPNIDWIESLSNCTKVEIIQTYLTSNPAEEIRIRQRGLNGNYIYTKTYKKNI